MIFRIDENNKLVLINDTDEELYADNPNFIVTDELPDALYPYYKFENGKIVPDEERILEKAKTLKIQEVYSKFNKLISSGYTCSNGITMDCRYEDIIKLKSGIELFEKIGSSTIIVRDYYNEDHGLPIEEANNMLIELGLHYLNLWKYKGIYIKAIKNMNNIDDVLNYEISFHD